MSTLYRIVSLCISLSLAMLSVMPLAAGAGELEQAPQDDSGRIIATVSTPLECLSTGDDQSLCSASGIVQVSWEGNIERARLVLGVAGAKAAHAIKINGQKAAVTPACASETLCSDTDQVYLSIPSEIIMQGDNSVEITDDAMIGDAWSATNIRIEVFSRPGDSSPSAQSPQTDVSDAASAFIFDFDSPYDGSRQEAVAQIPDSYSGNTPTPLVIYAHSRYGVMEEGLDVLGNAANSRGWLLAAPQMHGSWIVPEECFVYPNSCDYEDRVLAGTTSPSSEPKPGAFAHASLESQYDIIGTAKYMIANYNVKKERIYLVGYSMGGQIATVTAAKYPHLFAAVFDNKGITDLEHWYDQISSSSQLTLEKECHVNGTPKTPAQSPFCYERRSSVNLGPNYIHVPISITHSIRDALVPIQHSYQLRDAINAYHPDRTASVYEDRVIGRTCPPDYHCYEPNPLAVLNFLGSFTLNNRPSNVRVMSDESKAFYWLDLDQSGGDHWSEVEATYSLDTLTVSVTVTDSQRLTLGLNLGSTPSSPGGRDAIARPGMGLPATTYLIAGAGHNELVNYTSGMLSLNVASGGELTISAITVDLAADPVAISKPYASATTLTVQVRDRLGNPVPDGTAIQLMTTQGTFSNGQSTVTTVSLGGRATATLTLGEEDNLATVTAAYSGITDTIQVKVIHPAIELQVIQEPPPTHSGEAVTYEYRLENTGDTTLYQVTVADDAEAGNQHASIQAGGFASDGRTMSVCSGLTLTPGEAKTCVRSLTPSDTMTVSATATGQDVAGNMVSDSTSTRVTVIWPEIDLQVKPPEIVYSGQRVTIQYPVTNSGDITLTHVSVADASGIVCTDLTLTPSASASSCSRRMVFEQTTILTATVQAQDSLGAWIHSNAQATITVQAGASLYLPIIMARSN